MTPVFFEQLDEVHWCYDLHGNNPVFIGCPGAMDRKARLLRIGLY